MLLTDAEYPDIRAVIDTSLDSTALPDATIEALPFLPRADLEIKRRDASWASRSGEALMHLKIAAVYLTASYLVAGIPALTGERYGDYQYTRQATTPEQRARDLAAQAAAELLVLGITEGDTTPYLSGGVLTYDFME